jgi:hypothetical protein
MSFDMYTFDPNVCKLTIYMTDTSATKMHFKVPTSNDFVVQKIKEFQTIFFETNLKVQAFGSEKTSWQHVHIVLLTYFSGYGLFLAL